MLNAAFALVCEGDLDRTPAEIAAELSTAPGPPAERARDQFRALHAVTGQFGEAVAVGDAP